MKFPSSIVTPPSYIYVFFFWLLFNVVENNFHCFIYHIISFYVIRNSEVTEASWESTGISSFDSSFLTEGQDCCDISINCQLDAWEQAWGWKHYCVEFYFTALEMHCMVACFLSNTNALCFSKVTYSLLLRGQSSWIQCSQ